jgi:hypothetical protein
LGLLAGLAVLAFFRGAGTDTLLNGFLWKYRLTQKYKEKKRQPSTANAPRKTFVFNLNLSFALLGVLAVKLFRS